MRLPLTLVAGVLFAAPALAQTAAPVRYAEVRLPVTSPAALRVHLDAAGVQLDHAAWTETPAGRALRTVLSAGEVEALRAAGVPLEVLDADVAATYAARAAAFAGGCPATTYPVTGSMGCYPTLAEVTAFLDQMHAQYPALVSARTSIGQTGGGRDLWMVEISDNPGVDEGEAEALYTALHHAREPQGAVSVLHFMWDVLARYGTDPEATHLVRERRLFFVPVLNPDGYEHNRAANPEGGGMWRKNRRPNGGGSFGVDLNRNYGFAWGHDNSGSSGSPSSETYRGPGPFSEPETAALRDFLNGRRVRTALNYHTFGGLLLWPWGYAPTPSPDEATFARYGAPMTAVNGYTAGPGYTTIYPTNGGSDDWMYGEQTTKPRILSFTPEVGGDADGFWPAPSRILPLAEENLRMNYLLAWYAGGRVELDGGAYEEFPGGNGAIDPGEVFRLAFTIRNVGQGPAESVTYDIESTSPHITRWGGPFMEPYTMAPGEPLDLYAFSVRVSPDAPLGALPGLFLRVSYNGGQVTDTLALPPVTVGTPVALFADDASSMGAWTAAGGWGLSTTTHASPPSAFADSPAGPYATNANATLTLAAPLDLSAVTTARLRFRTRWDIEGEWDAGQLLASTDGATWTPLAGRYTTAGSGSGVQPAGQPVYDGAQTAWVEETVDLAAYVGQPNVRLRYRLRADGFDQRDGWYVDDVRVETLVNGATTAGEGGPAGPRFGLDAPRPNPARGAVAVGFTLDVPGPAEVAVFDVLGRRVATLADGRFGAGRHVVRWAGEGTPPGLYVLRLTSAGRTASRPLTYLR